MRAPWVLFQWFMSLVAGVIAYSVDSIPLALLALGLNIGAELNWCRVALFESRRP